MLSYSLVIQNCIGIRSNYKNSNIKIKTVQIDFNKSTELDYYQDFMTKIKDIDVSVFVNNAGVMYMKPFDELSLDEIKETFETNLYGVSILTSLFIQRFLKRKNRCGIVNVASVAGVIPSILVQHYAATKAYVRSLTYSLHSEIGDKIDILTHSPCYVNTAMTKFYKRIDVASPRDCAHTIFRDLGYEIENNPTLMHEFQTFLVKLMKDFSNPLFNTVSWMVGKYEYENFFKDK